jgi:UPF0716 protein FxsA
VTRLLLVVVFIVVPLIELAIIIQVGDLLGPAWTILLLLAVSLAGAWLVRREGVRAWTRFRTALGDGRVPADEVLEGALVLFGGALLLTPGFATDAVGLLLMVPPVRAGAAATLRRQLGARFVVTSRGGQRRAPTQHPRGTPRGAPPGDDDVVDVEVISVERTSDAARRAAGNGDVRSDGGST